MDELSDYNSPVIEFKATHKQEKQLRLIDNSTGTDPLPALINKCTATTDNESQTTQTEIQQSSASDFDENKLAKWLQKIYPNVERELLKGCTPLLDSLADNTNITTTLDYDIRQYQKITLPTPAFGDADTQSQLQGVAIWLSVHTNNAPVLVVSGILQHDDWCEHTEQCLRIYIPKRLSNANLLIYNEVKTVPIKACLKSLCTNSFNKNIFAGSTLDGDLFIWQYEPLFRNSSNGSNSSNGIEVKILYSTTSPHGYAVAMDWSSEHNLLTAHSNGYVVQWHMAKEGLLKEAEYFIKSSLSTATSLIPSEISSLLSLDLNDFIVGCQDGAVYHCWNSSVTAMKRNIEMKPLKRHLFMVTTLLKSLYNDCPIVISCDLSGQLYYHNLRNFDEDANTVIMQIPLPFKNAISCSRDASVIYCPGEDGSLECYRLQDGLHFNVKGNLKGKGNFIRSSDNGCWIITGLYNNEFQIFSIEN